jgi:hypothetical protein
LFVGGDMGAVAVTAPATSIRKRWWSQCACLNDMSKQDLTPLKPIYYLFNYFMFSFVSLGFEQTAIVQQTPLPTTNTTLWTISNLEVGGLSRKESDAHHYVRSATQTLWEDLMKNDHLWIDGCPGVGKSTTVFGWAMHIATKEDCQKSVMWLHFDVKGDLLFLKVIDGEAFRGKSKGNVACIFYWKWLQVLMSLFWTVPFRTLR